MARKQLLGMPQLLSRIANIVGINEDDDNSDSEDEVEAESKPRDIVDLVWRGMWKFNNSYSIGTVDGKQQSCLCTCSLPIVNVM